MIEINVWLVFIASTITALCTGLGVIPFLFVKDFSRLWLGVFNSIAAGLMLGASHQLVNKGMFLNSIRTLLGLVIGLALIVVADKIIERHGGLKIKELVKGNSRKIILILGVMTAHSLAEGIGVGVSFGGGKQLGVYVSAAIAIHNIPEGLAICLVLIPEGIKAKNAAGWSIFTSLPQPLMAVPAFLFVLIFTPLLPIGLGLAAGAMIWMVFAELIPDALSEAPSSIVGIAVTLAFVAMQVFQMFLTA